MIAPTRASHTRYTTRMRHAFAGLTTIQQQTLYLTAVEHCSVEAVARRLSLPVKSVERIAAAARIKVYQQVAA